MVDPEEQGSTTLRGTVRVLLPGFGLDQDSGSPLHGLILVPDDHRPLMECYRWQPLAQPIGLRIVSPRRALRCPHVQ